MIAFPTRAAAEAWYKSDAYKPAHDYKAIGRDHYAWESTVGEQRAKNVHVGAGMSRAEFVELRHKRDATLGAPRLLYPSLQVNIRAGRLPPADAAGRAFLRVPIRTEL